MAVRERMPQRRFANASQEAAVGLLLAAEHFQQALGTICERHEITADQYRVLRILRGAPTGQARGEVAKGCFHRAPDITRMLDRMARQGLVRRARAADDRRCSVATLTKAGRALLARIDPEISTEMRRLTKSLSTPELQQLIRLVKHLTP